jgi:hypothetical protein
MMGAKRALIVLELCIATWTICIGCGITPNALHQFKKPEMVFVYPNLEAETFPFLL